MQQKMVSRNTLHLIVRKCARMYPDLQSLAELRGNWLYQNHKRLATYLQLSRYCTARATIFYQRAMKMCAFFYVTSPVVGNVPWRIL